MIGFPGDGFHFPNGAIPLHGFRDNRAYGNGRYGLALYSVNGGAVDMVNIDTFSGDVNILGLVYLYGILAVGAGVCNLHSLKSEANSWSHIIGTNGHEWIPSMDMAQLNCVTLDHCSAHFDIELDHANAASYGSHYYKPGPGVFITDSSGGGLVPSVTYRVGVHFGPSDSVYQGYTPYTLNDTVSDVTVATSVKAGAYPPGSAAFSF